MIEGYLLMTACWMGDNSLPCTYEATLATQLIGQAVISQFPSMQVHESRNNFSFVLDSL